MMSYLNNEKAVEGIMKNYSREEINEKFRADPSDGLRPLKIFKKILIMKK